MRKIDILREKEVRNAAPAPGKFVKRLADGGGLYLQATISNEGINRNWIFRYERDGVRHDLGVGPLHTVGLAEARRRARDLRLQLLDSVDPMAARQEAQAERQAKIQAAKAAAAKAMTFRECAQRYLSIHADKWGNAKHREQWVTTLESTYPVIGDLSVADIDEAHLLKVLGPMWKKTPVTAQRLRGRIENVLGFAIVSKFRAGPNPAVWKNHLATLLGGSKTAVEHHAALPFAECPAFLAKLRQKDSIAARALEFTILTAARTGETIGATWDEIDLKAKIWIVPAERMKAGKEHRVPLTPRAVEILNGLKRAGPIVFGSEVTNKPMTNRMMLDVAQAMRPGQKITVHGFRSSFRDWAGETTNFPNAVVEMALAHAVGSATEKAYRRGDLFERRRKLMDMWATYLSKPMPAEGTNVTAIHAAR